MVALGLSCTGGCRWLMDTTPERNPVQPPPLKVATRVAPVQADEVTPANARSKAQLLLEEIEQDNGKE
jgi:hypothetical protein